MATRIIENYLVDTIEILSGNGSWRCEVRLKTTDSAKLLKSATLKATFDSKELAASAGFKAGQNLIDQFKKSQSA